MPVTRNRAVRCFLMAEFVSALGTGMVPIAMAFLVTESGRGALEVSVVLGGYLLPGLLGMFVGGSIGDRRSRRSVLVWTNVAGAIVQMLAFVLLLRAGDVSILLLAAVTFALGAIASFSAPASFAIIPSLVPDEDLERVNGVSVSANSIAAVVAPAAGGLIVAAVGPSWALLVDAVSFALAAALMLLVPRDAAPAATVTGYKPSMVRHMLAGLGYLRRRRGILVLIVYTTALASVAMSLLAVMGPVRITETGGSSAKWGLVLASQAVGLVAASAVIARRRIVPSIRLFLVSVLAGVPFLVTLAFTTSAWFLVPVAVLAGLGAAVVAIAFTGQLQRLVDDEFRSRVIAFDGVVTLGTMTVYTWVGGSMASLVGAGAALLGAGALCVLVVVVALARGVTAELRELWHVRG